MANKYQAYVCDSDYMHFAHHQMHELIANADYVRDVIAIAQCDALLAEDDTEGYKILADAMCEIEPILKSITSGLRFTDAMALFVSERFDNSHTDEL